MNAIRMGIYFAAPFFMATGAAATQMKKFDNEHITYPVLMMMTAAFTTGMVLGYLCRASRSATRGEIRRKPQYHVVPRALFKLPTGKKLHTTMECPHIRHAKSGVTRLETCLTCGEKEA